MSPSVDNRGVSPVIATVLMVAIVVVLAATIGVTMLGVSDDLRDLTAPMTYGENLVENPDFENGDANWKFVGTDWNTAEIAAGEGVGESSAIRLQTDGYTEQKLDSVLRPDAEYRLCAQSRLDSAGDGRAWVGVQHADGGPENHLAIWEVTWDDYRSQCGYFEADRKLENITVWVYTEGETSVLADEFVLQRTRYLTDER